MLGRALLLCDCSFVKLTHTPPTDAVSRQLDSSTVTVSGTCKSSTDWCVANVSCFERVVASSQICHPPLYIVCGRWNDFFALFNICLTLVHIQNKQIETKSTSLTIATKQSTDIRCSVFVPQSNLLQLQRWWRSSAREQVVSSALLQQRLLCASRAV